MEAELLKTFHCPFLVSCCKSGMSSGREESSDVTTFHRAAGWGCNFHRTVSPRSRIPWIAQTTPSVQEKP
jgi:hypothetical protein